MTIFSHLHTNFCLFNLVSTLICLLLKNHQFRKLSHIMFLYIQIQYTTIILLHCSWNTPTTPSPNSEGSLHPQPSVLAPMMQHCIRHMNCIRRFEQHMYDMANYSTQLIVLQCIDGTYTEIKDLYNRLIPNSF